jgi:lysyl-tRNA synthetase class I
VKAKGSVVFSVLKQLKQYRRKIETIYMNDRYSVLKKVYSSVRNIYNTELSKAKDGNFYD